MGATRGVVQRRRRRCSARTGYPMAGGGTDRALFSSGLSGSPLATCRSCRRRLPTGCCGVGQAGPLVPPAKDSFLFCGYRDVYLRGQLSGIPSEHLGGLPPLMSRRSERRVEGCGSEARKRHDRRLDLLLQQNGWQPPVEMLERIGCWNAWVADDLRRRGEWAGSEQPGLTVFFLRKRAIEKGLRKVCWTNWRGRCFLDPLIELTADQMADVTREVRGGNWGRGPFPVSGGEPGFVIIAPDPAPIAPDQQALTVPLARQPAHSAAKQAVRKLVNRRAATSATTPCTLPIIPFRPGGLFVPFVPTAKMALRERLR